MLAATISFDDPQIPALKTDPKTGKYRGEVKVGSYKVTVSAAGYQAGQGQVKVDLKLVEVAKEFPKPATVPVVAPVIAKGVLLGTVTDATGKILAATVSFDDPRVPALKADPKTGKYRGEVALGKYKIKVEAVGYRLVEGKVEVKAKEEAQADFQLKLEIPADKGFLVGLVTDETGKALSAVIRFDDSTVPEIKTDVKTGGYRREIAPGKYKVTVLAKDYEVFEDKVRVKGGEETLADFKLKLAPVLAKGVLLGTVTDATGKVLAATVSFDDPQVPALKTDPKTGKYRGEVAPGKYKVKVAAAGYELAEQKVKVEKREETQVDFQLKMTVALVSGPKPAPVKPPQAEKLERVVLATDPASGEFIRTLPAGRYRVEVEAAGFVKQARNVLIAEERETHLEIVLEPIKPPLGTLLGSVKMEKEKTPLAAIINFDQPKIPNLATDPASGNFMGSLPPGIYQATAFSQGFLPQTKQVEIKMGEDTRVDFLLSPTEVQVELGDLRDPENGKYFLKLPPGNYSVKAAASNFKSQTKNGIIVANKVTELNFVLEPLQLVRLTKKKIQILEKIHFEYDKSDILADSFPILDEVAQVLGDNPTIKLTIEGHTDIMGSHEYNMKLSQARVDSVRNYLISKGINQDRLLAVGYGATRPIADNATALGRAMNRRVEFVIQE
ncbi:MAG: carboxypeptidase regulatory-like domain-containing protein [Proteobacteria bacterium]|nr:carboxypeptidase regulatory-like domain-containing protein [Pseudomonadota bacterium]